MRSLEQKALAYVSEREGGFAAFLFSSANAEFAQVRVKTLSHAHAHLAPGVPCADSLVQRMEPADAPRARSLRAPRHG
jgi:hypothetical protein